MYDYYADHIIGGRALWRTVTLSYCELSVTEFPFVCLFSCISPVSSFLDQSACLQLSFLFLYYYYYHLLLFGATHHILPLQFIHVNLEN